jgi:DNA (cytosine-5)-methyltransferase 1
MPGRGFVPVVDLFAGPGGLGEGFTSFRGPDGPPCFKVQLSIEKDAYAHQTLLLRAFYRQFPAGRVPALYYDVLRGTARREQLFARFPEQAERASAEAWQAELGSTPSHDVRQRIRAAIGDSDEWVLVGGPPCQAYSVVGRSRNKGVGGYRPERDERQYLYAEYLTIIADHWPAIFVMENVKGLLSAKLHGWSMFERIYGDLENPARAVRRRPGDGRNHKYTIVSVSEAGDLFHKAKVSDYVVQAERYGIPQARHRVILVGVRDDLRLPASSSEHRLVHAKETATQKVLDRLPALRSGLSHGEDSATAWMATISGARERRWVKSAKTTAGTAVQSLIVETIDNITAPKHGRGADFIAGDFRTGYEPDWFYDGKIEGICNHSTRGHMPRDIHRYLYAACYARCHGHSPSLRNFPSDLLPEHKNVGLALNGHGYFGDRFRVQLEDRPATTITSHMAKDGHGFIHPDPRQCRSLTPREGARLQTFPDNYLFCGPRTQQCVQIGNAVPPLLARGIAKILYTLLTKNGLTD